MKDVYRRCYRHSCTLKEKESKRVSFLVTAYISFRNDGNIITLGLKVGMVDCSDLKGFLCDNFC